MMIIRSASWRFSGLAELYNLPRGAENEHISDCSIMLYLKSHHHTQGYCYTKPEVILRLEQAEDPCLLEKEFLIRRSSEDCQHDNLVEKSQEVQDRHLWQVSFAPFQRTDTGGQSFNQESRLRVNQGNHADVTPFECGQNFSHNSTHTTEKFCDHNICRGTLSHQSACSV
ncbi:zinc finger protein 782-like isoform X2 [Mirounga angustirostris]|uniref:zinc finger protein 782-like isoform X2 n=1 Tax=Mirounga angustirostris TaxID=9716 RepID=UPI00313C1B46